MFVAFSAESVCSDITQNNSCNVIALRLCVCLWHLKETWVVTGKFILPLCWYYFKSSVIIIVLSR